MLLYHPATDFFHCWMRFASLLCSCGGNGVEYDRLRIIDFLLCFPHELHNCRLPIEYSGELRKNISPLRKTYEDPFSIRQGFAQVNKIQKHVAMDMVAKGIVQRDSYREGILIPSTAPTISGLLESVALNWEDRNQAWHKLIVTVLLSIPLNGKNGLKDRSGLLEFKYDG